MEKAFDSTWEKIHSQRIWGSYPCEDVVRFMAKNYYAYENRKSIKVLDFGCGAGANTWYLANEGFTVVGLDASESAINNAKKVLEKFGVDAQLGCADGLETEFQDKSFDCIIDNRSIFSTKYENVIKLYREMFRLLKNGGKLFTSCFSSKTTGAQEAVKLDRYTYTEFRRGIFSPERVVCLWDTPDDIKGLLLEIGYSDVSVELHIETKNDMKIYNEMYIVSATKSI